MVKIGSVTIKNSANGEILVNIQNPISNNNSLGTSQKMSPTQNAVKSYVDSGLSGKQNTLVSETNIKSLTINGTPNSLLGSGTINVDTGGGGSIVTGILPPVSILPSVDGEIYINTFAKKFYIGLTADNSWYEITTSKFSGGTVLLMHFDGANNTTTFIDEKGKTVSRFGNPVISTTQSKFGGASGAFNLSTGNDLITIADSNNDFQLGVDDFTIEVWIYPTAINSVGFSNNILDFKYVATYSCIKTKRNYKSFC